MISLSKEVCDLAKHHFDGMQNRFPSYKHILHEWRDYWWMCVETKKPPALRDTVLVASFCHDSVMIVASNGRFVLRVYYADPKFTDDFLSDIIKEWEMRHI